MPRVEHTLPLTFLTALVVTAGTTAVEPAPLESFTPEQRAHWAYQVPARPMPPAVKELGWVRNPIDRFVLAGLQEMGLPHAREADRVALLRRVTFDLTGLPPTAEQAESFLNDSRPDAYERLVDRLLDSPAYGERWAQHWLDLAHYADSNGFELDAERPDAWRYRDWVVAALNADMPYDRFLTLQLAGDEAAPGDPGALVATGFGRCGPREVVGGNADPAVKRQSELTEITGTVGSVFLGLTVACARCHDHKFDALPTTDYYRLQSFFAAAELVDKPIASPAEQASYEAAKKDIDAKTAPLRQAIAQLEVPYRNRLAEQKKALLTPAERALMAIPEKDRTPAQKRLAEGFASTLKISWEEVAEAVAANAVDHAERERLKRAIYEIERTLPRPPAHAMALVDDGKGAPDVFVYKRGDPKNRGPKVGPHPPGIVLASLSKPAFPEQIEPTPASTGRRLALARWLVRADNPLTARVIVNRLWQHHFGRGIVATPSDFGVRGEPPTHPELLDWLATELVAQGWRLKPLHRLMVTSAVYRQSHVADPKLVADDPENALLGRMNRRRLEAESLRDALLAVTSELSPRAGGPGVLVPIEKEVEDLIFTEAEVVDLWPETPDSIEHLRRSLYLFRKRNVRYPLFEAFDAPDTQTACPQRGVSTHALQALVLINSDFVSARAKALAGRVLYETAGGNDARVLRAYKLVLAREPNQRELEQARAFIAAQADLLRREARQGQKLARPSFKPASVDDAEAAAWVDFALAMLNRNEFIYIP
ncbi:MAG: DUF1549 and DUF1553 domain-containing protein [Isosphaeraceae bacterium]|nr:DUF1549 and DUF1553 domain-containing protein [Isosphaeraceae bacterium]